MVHGSWVSVKRSLTAFFLQRGKLRRWGEEILKRVAQVDGGHRPGVFCHVEYPRVLTPAVGALKRHPDHGYRLAFGRHGLLRDSVHGTSQIISPISAARTFIRQESPLALLAAQHRRRDAQKLRRFVNT